MQALIFFGEVLLFMNWAPVGDMVLVSQCYLSIVAVSKLVRLADVTNLLQSQTKVYRAVELDHISPIPLSNVGKCHVFSTKREKFPNYQHCVELCW